MAVGVPWRLQGDTHRVQRQKGEQLLMWSWAKDLCFTQSYVMHEGRMREGSQNYVCSPQLTSAQQGINKKFIAQLNDKCVLQRTYFLMHSSASSSVFFNAIDVCIYKLLIMSFLARDRLFYKIGNSNCSPHKHMKQLIFYGAIHASSSINVFLVNTYSLFG